MVIKLFISSARLCENTVTLFKRRIGLENNRCFGLEHTMFCFTHNRYFGLECSLFQSTSSHNLQTPGQMLTRTQSHMYNTHTVTCTNTQSHSLTVRHIHTNICESIFEIFILFCFEQVNNYQCSQHKKVQNRTEIQSHYQSQLLSVTHKPTQTHILTVHK